MTAPLDTAMSSHTEPLPTGKRNGKRPRIFDASTGDLVPIPRTPLKTLDHVRNELAKVYRGMKAGRLAHEDGTKRAYVLVALGKVIEIAQLEKRLEVLERQQQQMLTGPTGQAGE